MSQKHRFVIVNITDTKRPFEVEHLGEFATKDAAYNACVEYQRLMGEGNIHRQYKIKAKRVENKS